MNVADDREAHAVRFSTVSWANIRSGRPRNHCRDYRFQHDPQLLSGLQKLLSSSKGLSSQPGRLNLHASRQTKTYT
jgi:hypothetical protein